MLLYYYDAKKRSVAHLWDDKDTFCGILKLQTPEGREVYKNKLQRPVCALCAAKWKQWDTGLA